MTNLRTMVIYIGVSFYLNYYYLFFWVFFLRIVIMNPFKNLHDNCQGLFLFLIITQHPDPLSHLFIEESGLFVLFVCHIEISKIMVSPPPLATLGTDGFNPQWRRVHQSGLIMGRIVVQQLWNIEHFCHLKFSKIIYKLI